MGGFFFVNPIKTEPPLRRKNLTIPSNSMLVKFYCIGFKERLSWHLRDALCTINHTTSNSFGSDSNFIRNLFPVNVQLR